MEIKRSRVAIKRTREAIKRSRVAIKISKSGDRDWLDEDEGKLKLGR